MKRVVHLSSVHPAFDVRIFHKECRSLSEAGYEVHLVIQAERDSVRDGVYIHALKKPKNRMMRMTRTVWEAFGKARSLKGDIYHFHDPELLPVGFLLQALGERVVFDVHENISAQILDKYWLRYPRLIGAVYSWLERLFIRRGMQVVLAEKSYREHYAGISPDCLTLLNYPRAPQQPIVPYEDRTDSIIYVGVIGPIRGLDQILEALAILRKKGLSPRFDCVGSFYSLDYEKSSREKVKRLGLGDMVCFHGWRDNKEALQLMGRSKIGLSIMLPIPNYIESYSTKIFEYMALEIPFVVSDFPIYRDIISYAGKCGIPVDPLNPQAIADSMEYLLTHPDEAARMGQRGRRAIESKYNWHVEEKKLLALYARLLKT